MMIIIEIQRISLVRPPVMYRFSLNFEDVAKMCMVPFRHIGILKESTIGAVIDKAVAVIKLGIFAAATSIRKPDQSDRYVPVRIQ